MSTTSVGGGVFRQSEDYETFELLIDGNVIETVVSGGVCGEMAIVGDNLRSATAVAKTDCNLVPVGERKFQQLILSAPFFAVEVMRAMADRLPRMNAAAG